MCIFVITDKTRTVRAALKRLKRSTLRCRDPRPAMRRWNLSSYYLMLVRTKRRFHTLMYGSFTRERNMPAGFCACIKASHMAAYARDIQLRTQKRRKNACE